MKALIKDIINEYLEEFPDEKDKLHFLIEYVETHSYEELTDWNNFNGHLVAGAFIYAQKEDKYLVLHHKDLNMYLYPGGHFKENENPLEAAIREVKEETGIFSFNQVIIKNSKQVPIDIDIQTIEYNTRLDLPEHIHYDFRYLFVIDSITNINIDTSELSSFKWITPEEFKNDTAFGKVIDKINKYILK